MGFSAQHPRVRVFSKVHPRPTHIESKPQKSDIFLGFRLNPDQANIYLGDTFAAVHTRCSVHRFELIAVKDNKADLFFDLRNRARWKKKHRRSPPRGILAPRAHARSTERSVRGVSHHNPFARRIRAVSVSSNRTGTRGGSHRSAGGSFPHLPLPTKAESESEAGLRLGTCTPARCTRARRPRISSGRPDQSSRKDSRCVRRPGSRRAPSHRPSPRVPQIGGRRSQLPLIAVERDFPVTSRAPPRPRLPPLTRRAIPKRRFWSS